MYIRFILSVFMFLYIVHSIVVISTQKLFLLNLVYDNE